MSAEPMVTVVIPTRDRADLLRVTLHSILASVAEAQRVGIATRILVVDDASMSSSTRELAGELGVDYDRIEVHDGRDNPASAIVRGVAQVRTPYLTLFGDDDVMLPRYIRAHVEHLDEGYDLCSSSFSVVDGDLAFLRTRVLAAPHLGDLLGGSVMINDGAMVRTELVQGRSWDPTLDQEVLYPVWLEVLIDGARTTTLNEPTWWYRRHQANISNDIGPDDAVHRQRIQAHYRAVLLERYGEVPSPQSTASAPAPAAAVAQATEAAAPARAPGPAMPRPAAVGPAPPQSRSVTAAALFSGSARAGRQVASQLCRIVRNLRG